MDGGPLPGFFIAIASGVVFGVAALLIIYKMIDGHIHVGIGLASLVIMALAEALAIRPSHPAIPGVILVVALSLMAFFPFAERTLEDYELRGVDADRLARSFEALRVRPDNYAAKFDLANLLHKHGFVSQAVHVSSTALNELDTQRDEVKNRSMREVFHREEVLLKRWKQEPQSMEAVKCPNCGTFNRPTELLCTKCAEPYMLHIVRGVQVKPKVMGRLVLAWAVTALFIPVSVVIGMDLDGVLRYLAFGVALTLLGALMAWLFKPPQHSSAIVTERY